jgi:ADP-ribosyl-[dinitrogen reductase] hydrolase
MSDGQPSHRQRLIGGLLGVVVGDAIGVPWEFQPANSAPLPTPAVGFQTFHQPPGTWSDDGAMTLALLESLLEVGWDLDDQGRRFLAWFDEAHYTATGVCFDSGIATTAALDRIRAGVPPARAGSDGDRSQSNGGLMRILPVALMGRDLSDAELVRRAEEGTAVTHAHPRVVVASAIYVLVARALLRGEAPRQARDWAVATLSRLYADAPERRELVASCLVHKEGLGHAYVADSLLSALRALEEGRSFRDVVELAISYGHDTDTTAAIAGGLAGIQYGAAAIPEEWMVAMRAAPGWFIVDTLAHQLGDRG